MACLVLSLMVNIILFCRLKKRKHEYSLEGKPGQQITEAVEVKSSEKQTIEPGVDKTWLLCRRSADVTEVWGDASKESEDDQSTPKHKGYWDCLDSHRPLTAHAGYPPGLRNHSAQYSGLETVRFLSMKELGLCFPMKRKVSSYGFSHGVLCSLRYYF